MSYLYAALGAAITVAGADKLAGNRGYDRMFRELGLSKDEKQAAALAEIVGGLFMVPRATRRMGGAVVAATSSAMLVSELRHGDEKLAMARGMVLLAGLAALFAPGR